jgi:DNA topoisomerase-2
MQEFSVLREQLYHRRKEFLLAKLKKEWVLIDNKVKFILAIINEEITINKVKKKIIVAKLKQMGFKTMSEINEILPEKKKVTLRQDDGEEEKVAIEEEEVVAPGETPAKEYDYLLTMALMSLTEEKVEEL